MLYEEKVTLSTAKHFNKDIVLIPLGSSSGQSEKNGAHIYTPCTPIDC